MEIVCAKCGHKTNNTGAIGTYCDGNINCYGVYQVAPWNEKANDEINHPAHYNHGKIEPIDVIEDWNLNFNVGNALKYIARHQHKGDPLKNLQKARWYLDREIGRLEK